MKVLALDFGGSSVKYGVVDENATITNNGKFPAPLDSIEQLTDAVKEIYEEYKDDVAGIGISFPGNINPETGFLYEGGVYMKLYEKSVKELIQANCKCPVEIENDGKCAALSEAWKGSLKDVKDGIVLILGSGIAGGIIKDHKVHSGKGFNAGEFSYTITNPGDASITSCAYFASAALGITYKLCKMKNLDFAVQDSAPTLEYMDKIFGDKFPKEEDRLKQIKVDGKQFFKWVQEGDSDAVKVYKDFVTALATLIFNAQICYAPERIVIGGGLSLADQIIPDIQKEVDRYYKGFNLSDRFRAEIVRSTYLNESNLYGATYNFMIRNS